MEMRKELTIEMTKKPTRTKGKPKRKAREAADLNDHSEDDVTDSEETTSKRLTLKQHYEKLRGAARQASRLALRKAGWKIRICIRP